MAKKDWARWVFASVVSAMKEVAGELNLPALVEHLDERTEAFMRAGDRAEIRVTGPFLRELSKDYYRLSVDVNILLTGRFDGEDKNAYDIVRYAGAFQDAMDAPIAVWNYGNQPGDYSDGDPATQVFLGCLLPRSGRNDSVKVMHFGQIDPVDKIRQSEVDARYVMELIDA
jgi:hypothetical protein